MLDCLTFKVLLSTRLIKVVVASEPIENCLIAISGTFKEWVFAQVVLLHESLVLVFIEYLEHFKVLHLGGKENWRLSFEVSLETVFWP